MSQDNAENLAKNRSTAPSSASVTQEKVDKEKADTLKKEKADKRTRMIAAQKNKTKMVKMEANIALRLPKKTAEKLNISREVAAGEVVTIPADIAEMFCMPAIGFIASEGGEWSGTNRPKHKTIRAKLVQ